MIAAWKAIKAEESALRQDAAIGATLQTDSAADCDLCYGGGFRFKEHPADTAKSGFVRCDHSEAAVAPNDYEN
ncbi:MAG: hypothetical protein IPM21_03095 [Acidobacteria bacterium]|nr:hypothetical protein [Acidobacteriota bacterium]